MAKAPKPAHALNHGGIKRRVNAKPKRGKVGLVSEKQNMTELRWQTVIERIAEGDDIGAAPKAAKISVRTVDAFLISNIAAAGQLRDAKLIWNRRDWPLDEIENVLARIAVGRTVRQAFDDCGIARDRLGSLYRVFLYDKAIRKMYDEAREMQAESFADDIIDISDSSHSDRNEDGKVDHEVINRDRLRVDSRKWLSARWNLKRFGDNKHVQVDGDLNINHAAILTGGRKRIEQLAAKRKGNTIENDSGRVVINE